MNSRALELAGITRETPDPSGGRIERDAAGEPQGTLHEEAMDLVGDLLPPITPDEWEAGILRAQAPVPRARHHRLAGREHRRRRPTWPPTARSPGAAS